MTRKPALAFSERLDLSEVLTRVGDGVNVFIPVSFVTADYLSGPEWRSAFGSRPYSPVSDLVTIVCHMGILFPNERPKKAAHNLLLTSPTALRFDAADVRFEDARRIDDDFRINGVVVTVVAKPPLDAYPAAQGYGIASRALSEAGAVSVDIVDFHFASEFEPAPDVSDAAAACLFRHEPADDDDADDAGEGVTLRYSRGIFEGGEPALLLEDFDLAFVCDEGEFRLTGTGDDLVVKRVAGAEEEETRGLRCGDLRFGDDSVEIGDLRITGILRVVVSAKDRAE